MNFLVLFGSLFIVLCCLLYFINFGISHIIDVHANHDGIVFVLFRAIRVYVLNYECIETCKPYKLWDFSWFDGKLSTIFLTLTVGGWPRLSRVMLKMKRGPFAYIFLFPYDPMQFAAEVQAHLEHSRPIP
jgi:hypothetical protein